jgi:hypothetical protein
MVAKLIKDTPVLGIASEGGPTELYGFGGLSGCDFECSCEGTETAAGTGEGNGMGNGQETGNENRRGKELHWVSVGWRELKRVLNGVIYV